MSFVRTEPEVRATQTVEGDGESVRRRAAREKHIKDTNPVVSDADPRQSLGFHRLMERAVRHTFGVNIQYADGHAGKVNLLQIGRTLAWWL